MTSSAVRGEAWQTHAACVSADTAKFFSRQPDAAKSICARCPVRPECLHDALDTDASTGIWGGLTYAERLQLPDLPRPRAAALAMLRDLLDPPLSDEDQPERTTPTMTETTTRTEELTTSALLRWAEDHADPDIQAQGARAEAALTGLRTRYVADKELAAVTDEASRLEERLAQLRARQAELAPAKKRRTAPVRDYDSRTVRAWAAEVGVDCPRVGQIPRKVLEAWRTATGSASSA